MASKKKPSVKYSHVVGGASTYSKAAFAGRIGKPYPTYAVSGDGATLCGENKGRFIDWTGSLGANILGHDNTATNRAIHIALAGGLIAAGIPTQLEEDVAQRFCDITGWQQVRFCKNGSDATEAAVRLARFHTDRKMIVTTGYHGSHSDLVSATEGKDGGVLADCYNHLERCLTEEELRLIVSEMEVAAVISEPIVRGEVWDWGEIKKACERAGTLLIFDEIITGFRVNYGSAVEVRPHLACYGKAIANGMPLALVAGPRRLMKHYEKDVFFSGTANGELLSLAACWATLTELRRASYPCFREFGRKIGYALEGISVGYPSRWTLDIEDDKKENEFRRQLAAKGILIGKDFFLNFAMTDDDVRKTVGAIEAVRKEMKL